MAEIKNHLCSVFKSSRYNHFVLSSDENSILGCNFLYRSVIRLPIEIHSESPDLLPFLTGAQPSFDQERLDARWRIRLIETGFIIDSESDELATIKFRYYSQLYGNDTLRLTILPTLWCNLDCPYCFEEKRKGVMREEVEEALLDWLQGSFSNKRNIHVAWFGGEPLLCKETISRLSKRLRIFAAARSANYSASMTTNGYYFDKEFHCQLNNLGLRSVQITLDGDREAHDKLRVRRSGGGSFDKIYRNILDFCEASDPGCELTIRINCTDDNFAGVQCLINEFPEYVTKRAKIFFRWVWPNEMSGNKIFSENLQRGEPFKPLYELYSASHDSGWRTSNPNNDQTSCYCEADYLDQFHVDPHGKLYLCSHTFREAEAVGTVFDSANYIYDKKGDYYLKWYASSPFDDAECVECKLLPICGGGCRKSRVEGSRQCIEEKQSIDLYARDYINQLGLQQQKGV